MSIRRMFLGLIVLATSACGSLDQIDRGDLNSPAMNLDAVIAGSLSPLSGLRGGATSSGGCSVCAH